MDNISTGISGLEAWTTSISSVFTQSH